MFDHALLERLSTVRPALPVTLYATVGIGLVWRSASNGLGGGAIVAVYAAGLLVWTLTEYLAHRVSFHHTPTTPLQVAYGYLIHGVHHAYPDDSRRWMIPVPVSLPISALLFWLFTLVFGRWAFPAFAGFIHGYLLYDGLHYAIHSGRMPTRLGRFLRQYHLTHHFATPDRHFGVSSPLWDLVFRTK